MTVGESRPLEKQRREAGRGECIKDLAKILATQLVEQDCLGRHLCECIVRVARLPLPGACKTEHVINEWPDVVAHLRQGSALLVVDGVDDEHPNEIAHRIAADTILHALDDVVPWPGGVKPPDEAAMPAAHDHRHEHPSVSTAPVSSPP